MLAIALVDKMVPSFENPHEPSHDINDMEDKHKAREFGKDHSAIY